MRSLPPEVYPVAVYAFRHPLTHEVALGSLLSERRRELHRRAAHSSRG
jgi:predicted ATPase